MAALNRLEIDDFDVERDFASSSAPTGSLTNACRRVATPASIRSSTTRLSRSSAVNSR